jgi:hypothetical protein
MVSHRQFRDGGWKLLRNSQISCQPGRRRVGELASASFCDRSGDYLAPCETAAGRAFR